jgi:hypothetical protein
VNISAAISSAPVSTIAGMDEWEWFCGIENRKAGPLPLSVGVGVGVGGRQRHRWVSDRCR